MKKNKFNIFSAWILLFCFAVGQYTVYVHQHKFSLKTQGESRFTKGDAPSTTTVQEKCYLCDAMHHSAAVINNVAYFSPVLVTNHVFKAGDYNFVSISLVLAAGRAPPASC